MIKIENDYVCLATIDAGMTPQVFPKERAIFVAVPLNA